MLIVTNCLIHHGEKLTFVLTVMIAVRHGLKLLIGQKMWYWLDTETPYYLSTPRFVRGFFAGENKIENFYTKKRCKKRVLHLFDIRL